MIRKATYSDIDDILKLTKDCAKYLISNEIYQWNENYPNKKAFLKDVDRSEIFVLSKENQIIGSITISDLMDDEYLPIKWLTPNENNLYIHRLSVHPEYQKRGYAQQLMTFAEQFAINNAYTSIRLDTFSKNISNQKFYELRQYKRLGNVYFPEQSEHPFYCYEFVL